jgi:cytochrome c peroxidase
MKKHPLILILTISLLGLLTFSCSEDTVYDDSEGVLLKSRTKDNLVDGTGLTPVEFLGKNLFFDKNLSANGKMSCATCHAPEAGFTGPSSMINEMTAVYPGAIGERFGNRKPPTAAYGGESPILFWEEDEGLWIGGMFWDGRATGWMLGDPLAEQAMGPFLNPVEQAAPDAKFVVDRALKSAYAYLFEVVWGSYDAKDVMGNYERIAFSISAYEKSTEVNPFSSKYDAYLAGAADLTEQEEWGLELFNDENKGKCALCHISEVRPGGEPPLFTDFTYDNLGIPKNPDNPFYMMDEEINPDGMEWVDMGLGGFLKSIGESYANEIGKHKVPTLRNVDKRPYEGFVKVYGHNGYFKSLEEIVHFYNTRDIAEENWPIPEVPETVNTEELGNLDLSAEEEAAIVAFMKTLTDGYVLE